MNGPEQESTSERSITTRLEAATRELNELEELVKSGALDSRVLSEFREAVDHIRSTTWAGRNGSVSAMNPAAIPLRSSRLCLPSASNAPYRFRPIFLWTCKPLKSASTLPVSTTSSTQWTTSTAAWLNS
jgi:hypothetical protein